jgi:hypothetical protein
MANSNKNKAPVSATAAGVRPDRKARVRRFSAKTRYADASDNSLTVSVRQVDNNGTPAFRVSVSHQKSVTGKRQRGMVDVYPTQSEAENRYADIRRMCAKAKWTEKVALGRSAFDTLPLPA